MAYYLTKNPMTDEENVAVDNSNTTEEEIQLDLEPVAEESVDEIKAKLAKAEELAQNYRIRAEKAERKAKEPENKPVQVHNTAIGIPNLTSIDTIAIMRANVPEDDITDVVEYAQFKKISVSEALKSSTVKNILAEKEEQRTVAQATNTGAARRGTSKVSDEALAQKAYKGELPESDEDIRRLYKARKQMQK